MDYNEIKACIDRCRKEIMSLKKSIKHNESERTNLREQLSSVESSYQLNLRESKDSALNNHLQQSTKQVDKELAVQQQKLETTQQKYNEQLEQLANSNIANSYSDEQAMTAEVRASLAVLQEQLNKSISRRFQQELESQLDAQVIDIQPSDVDTIVRFFNKQSRIISSLGNNTSIGKFIDNILKFVRVPLGEDMSSRKGKATMGVLSFVLVILFIFASKYVFPFYVIFLFILLLYNVSKSYKVFTSLIAQKAVKDNLQTIEDSLKQKAIQQVESRRKNLQNQYDAEMLNIQQRQDELLKQKDEILRQARNTFTFDDSDVQSRYQNAIKINNSRAQTLDREHQQLTAQLKQYQEDLDRFEKDLNNIAGDVQREYLNFDKIGTDVILNPKFIYDVRNAKPVYFVHPQSSALFLYENQEDIYDFVRLLLIQLRVKLNPYNLNCMVYDTEGLGVPYLSFNTNTEEADEAVKKLFRIVTDNTEIKNSLREYNDAVTKRIMTIRQSYDNIAEYNRDMLSSDSLTEPYEFIFFHNPIQQQLQDENFKKVYANGGSLGIYMHVFIKSSEFYEMGNNAQNLIESAGGIFVIKDGNILKRAKEFALENLIKSDD